MRKLMAVALAAGVLAGCSSQTLGISAPRQAAAPGVQAQSDTGLKQAIKHAVNSLFKNADYNHDGVLAPNENHGLNSEEFAKADKNKDYKLTVTEFIAHYKAQQPQLMQNLRQNAQGAFQYTDRNRDNAVTFDEFHDMLNPTPMPVTPYPGPDPSSGYYGPYSAQTANAYAPGYPSYDPGYGGYDPGYGTSPYYPSYPTVTRQHAATMFNLSDRNRDRKLTLSEFEDLHVWMEASNLEPNTPSMPYPTAYPSATPVTPMPPLPTAIPSTPATTKAQSVRR